MKTIRIPKRTYPIHTDTVIVSTRIPVTLAKQLDAVCAETGRSRSDVIQKILEDFLD